MAHNIIFTYLYICYQLSARAHDWSRPSSVIRNNSNPYYQSADNVFVLISVVALLQFQFRLLFYLT